MDDEELNITGREKHNYAERMKTNRDKSIHTQKNQQSTNVLCDITRLFFKMSVLTKPLREVEQAKGVKDGLNEANQITNHY